MPKMKNTRTGKVVEVPDTAPGLDRIKGRDEAATKKLREIRQKKHDQTIAVVRRSKRWAPTNEAPTTRRKTTGKQPADK